jgi:hypothetical protein
MEPVAWAVQYPDGKIDYELVGTKTEVEWWCASDEGRAAGRHPVKLFLEEIKQPVVTLDAHILAEYTLGTGRRQRVNLAADLYPGDVVILTDDFRTKKAEGDIFHITYLPSSTGETTGYSTHTGAADERF